MADIIPTKKCIVLRNKEFKNYFSVSGIDQSVNGYVLEAPFNDNDLVSAIACLGGARVLQTFGRGFGRASIVIRIFCSDETTGIEEAESFYKSNRISNNITGVSVTAKGGPNFLMFPDTFSIQGYDATTSAVMAVIEGFAYTQKGGGGGGN